MSGDAPPARHTPRAKLSRRWLSGLLFLQLIMGLVLVIGMNYSDSGETRDFLGFLAPISILPPPFFVWFLARESSTLYAFEWVVSIRVLGLLFCLAQTFLIFGPLYVVLRCGAEIHDADVLLTTTILLFILSLCTFFSLIAVCLCNPWGRSETNPLPPRAPSAPPAKSHLVSARGWLGLLLALTIGGGAAYWVYRMQAKPTLAPPTPEEIKRSEEGKQRQDAAAKALGVERELTLDLGGGVTMKLVLIPPGKFLMGTPKTPETVKECSPEEWPQREVTISKPFYLGVYEVTRVQYERVTGKKVLEWKDDANAPVGSPSWDDAADFCKELSAKSGKKVRLPTEAEWEYACRAGTNTRFSFGDSYDDLDDYAWHGGNSDGRIHPVGEKKPNAFGLYDMHGNVWEWCSDWFADSYANAKDRDPVGPDSGTLRVLRGGGWYCNPQFCRSACRTGTDPSGRGYNYGLRVAVGAGAADPSTQPATQPSPQPAAQPSAQPAKELTLDLGNKVTMKLALIPAGKFLMGSPDGEKDRKPDEGPQREVTISKPFHMGVFEVTQAQYEAVMGSNPSEFKGANRPVEKVSWDDAVEFCKKLSQKTGKAVRLPTEAQWEYACRAGTKTRFSFGDDDGDLHKYGNYCDKSNTDGLEWQDKNHNDGFDKTAPVGSFKPNAFGLYDMHGNVWEWCSDAYAESYANAKDRDPVGPDSGSARVLRGGSWVSDPSLCRSAYRIWGSPDYRLVDYGFRVVVVAGRVD